MLLRTWWLSLAGLVPLAVVLFFAAWLLPPDACPVTKAAYEKVKSGMTRSEVEAILGGPAGDYTTGEHEMGPGGPTHGRIFYWNELWEGDEGTVYLAIGEKGVLRKEFWPGRRTRPWTPLERMGHWIGRPVGRLYRWLWL
jgi:hypothetical protein